jgi:hypothetical protein
MGQYYKVVNLDKQEYIHPHQFDDGMKLMEFACSGSGTMAGLAILLAEGNGRGGGDLKSENPIIGSWSRDRIVVAGDYADPLGTDGIDDGDDNLFQISESWRDISDQVQDAMNDDHYLKGYKDMCRKDFDRQMKTKTDLGKFRDKLISCGQEDYVKDVEGVE